MVVDMLMDIIRIRGMGMAMVMVMAEDTVEVMIDQYMHIFLKSPDRSMTRAFYIYSGNVILNTWPPPMAAGLNPQLDT